MKIAICDDEPVFRKQVKTLVNRYLRAHKIKAKVELFDSGEAVLNSGAVCDIAFLDIEMKGINGIRTAEGLHQLNPECLIFFVTNHSVYLDDAFDLQAFRFLVKPVDEERLERGLDIAFRKLAERELTIEVSVYERKAKIRLSVGKIIYIINRDRKTLIVTTNGQVLVEETYRQVKEMIGTQFFCETHQSYFVNLNYVTDYDRETVTMTSGAHTYTVYLSRRKYPAFNEKFCELVGERV